MHTLFITDISFQGDILALLADELADCGIVIMDKGLFQVAYRAIE